jgi:hypothetical protein
MWLTRKDWQTKVALGGFVLLTLWWLYNNFVLGNHNLKYDSFFDFGEVYGYMAIWGGIWGFIISKKWGGFRSVMGKAIILFSLGLFAQEFGQLYLAFYNDIYKTAGPYPSLGDIGFFGTIPLYISGVLLLAKASGVHIKMKSFASQLQAVIIPLIMLIVAYVLFLQGYEFDWANPIKVFLDFGYPFGDAIYISLALLTFLLSRGMLGGVMKSKILFIVLALGVQFLADFSFLYQSSRGIYAVGGLVDLLYLCAYFLMTLGLLQLSVKSVRSKLDSHK